MHSITHTSSPTVSPTKASNGSVCSWLSLKSRLDDKEEPVWNIWPSIVVSSLADKSLYDKIEIILFYCAWNLIADINQLHIYLFHIHILWIPTLCNTLNKKNIGVHTNLK